MTPDAVMIPESWKTGDTVDDRALSILAIAEPILGVGIGGAHARFQSGWFFVTKNQGDTLLIPNGQEHHGKPRYRWEPQPDGTKHGFLIEGNTGA